MTQGERKSLEAGKKLGMGDDKLGKGKSVKGGCIGRVGSEGEIMFRMSVRHCEMNGPM